MELVLLKVSECSESETNPRGKDFEGKAFDELVASVKEKGILTPVLARKSGTKYEVIAGNRRLRAAKEAGLKEIPAQLVEMTDVEAREAQIIENLQREDVHPLEEGEAYRQLIEQSGLSVKDIAVRVGKSESYVRIRLFLTNLAGQAAKAYRDGTIPDSFAAVIAKLSPTAQGETIKYLKEVYRDVELSDLKEFIAEHFSNPLGFQPWLKDEAIAKVVGACKECPPNREDLFGKVKDGQCTDLKCWRRKIAAYIAWMKQEEPELALVSESYGKPDAPSAISHSDYELLESKKDYCDFKQEALIIEGENIGKVVRICASKECKDHHNQHTEYAPSPKEKEKRKKERERETAKKQKLDAQFSEALQKLTWNTKTLDLTLDLLLGRWGGAMILRPIAKRHGIVPKVTKHENFTERDYSTPVKDMVAKMDDTDKVRFVIELIVEGSYAGEETRKKVIKAAA